MLCPSKVQMHYEHISTLNAYECFKRKSLRFKQYFWVSSVPKLIWHDNLNPHLITIIPVKTNCLLGSHKCHTDKSNEHFSFWTSSPSYLGHFNYYWKSQHFTHVCGTKMMFFELLKGQDWYFFTRDNVPDQGICDSKSNPFTFWYFC